MDGVLALADGEIDSLSFGNLSVGEILAILLITSFPCGKCLNWIVLRTLICTGESSSLREIVTHVFACMGVFC